MLLIAGCSRKVFSTCKLNDEPLPTLRKLMKEWNVYDYSVAPLQQQCRRVILKDLSPQADKKIWKLSLPPCLIKFLCIPELDNIVYEYNKSIERRYSISTMQCTRACEVLC